MPAQLVPLDDGPSILVDKPILLLGRHPECDIQIDSRKVSRRHCCIAQVEDYLIIRDLGSTNGIHINGKRVNEGRLKTGDELMIGQYRYRVSWAEGSPRRPAARQAPPRPRDVTDDLLEDCDDPVALHDSAAAPGAGREDPSRIQGPPHDPAPPILPDNIDLLSGSGFHHPRPPH